MKKKWDEMTEEERERYVSQDEVKSTWREVVAADLGHDLFSAISGRAGMQTLQAHDLPWIEDSAFSSVLDPIELVCIKMFYCERMTRPEIAGKISVQHVVSGQTICIKAFTHNIVQKKLESARRKIKFAFLEPNGPFSRLIDN